MSVPMTAISSSEPLESASLTTTSQTKRSSPRAKSSSSSTGAPASPCAWSISTVVSNRYATRILPDPGPLPLGPESANDGQDLGLVPTPRRRILQGAGKLREHLTCVVTPHLSRHHGGDVAAAAPRAGDGIHLGQDLFRERDVGSHEAHRVCSEMCHRYTHPSTRGHVRRAPGQADRPTPRPAGATRPPVAERLRYAAYARCRADTRGGRAWPSATTR